MAAEKKKEVPSITPRACGGAPIQWERSPGLCFTALA